MLKWGISRQSMADRAHMTSPEMPHGDAGNASSGNHVLCHDNYVVKSEAAAAEPGDEPKKTPRRKRKLVPPPGTSSLLSATIQENSEYDKQLDAYRSKLLNVFSFIDNWQRNSGRFEHPHGLAQQVMLGLSSATPDESASGAAGADDRPGPGSPTLRRDPKSTRPMCVEEELQLRLSRMTSIAKTLRDLCSREREQRASLCKDIFECKDKCLFLLNDVVDNFNRETIDLQKRNTEMDKTIKELEKQKQEMDSRYEEAVVQATNNAEMLQKELENSGKEIRLLADEIRTLRNMHSRADTEKLEAQAEAEKLGKRIKGLEKQVKEAETKAMAADMARENFETLLNIALSKLRLYEDGEIVTQRKVSMEDVFEMNPGRFSGLQRPSSRTHTRRAMSDTYSMTSLDSMSMMSDHSMALADSAKYVSDDRLSTASAQSKQNQALQRDSPVVPPRRKHKGKKPFFNRPFMRKSHSNESQLSYGSTDRLPTIVDERERESLSRSQEQLSKSKVNLRKSRESVNSLVVPVLDRERSRSAERHITVVTVGDVKPLGGELRIIPKPTQPVKRKSSKKVIRTSSFGALKRPTGGLVAIAKDIEKRFKQKRRSKTADFSTILREPGETASIGTDHLENSQDESDIGLKDDIY